MGLIETALDYVSIKSALILLVVVYVLRWIYIRIDEATRLRRLGVRGPRVKSYLPFGKGASPVTPKHESRAAGANKRDRN